MLIPNGGGVTSDLGTTKVTKKISAQTSFLVMGLTEDRGHHALPAAAPFPEGS